MKKVYIVCWGSAGQDDAGNAKAYSNVHGVYAFLDDAKKGLEECKDERYNEIVNNPDYDEEDRELAEVNTSVYGSVNDDYFEIDYFIGDTPCEIYINIVEKEIQG
jgi:hypothetical protein